MSIDLQTLQEQLNGALLRIQHLEERLSGDEPPASPWKYLVARLHPWRRQLSLKGRNITVGQLLSTIRANKLSPEEASADLDLPVEAVREAIAYYEQNRGLIELEATEERRRLEDKGYVLEPRDLPR
jgi:uncharacterized protein (DUF433 family)